MISFMSIELAKAYARQSSTKSRKLLRGSHYATVATVGQPSSLLAVVDLFSITVKQRCCLSCSTLRTGTVMTSSANLHLSIRDRSDDNKTLIDSRLRPRCTTHVEYLLAFIDELNLVGISAVMVVVFCRRFSAIMRKHDVIRKSRGT